jgi:hypothetical protein
MERGKRIFPPIKKEEEKDVPSSIRGGIGWGSFT